MPAGLDGNPDPIVSAERSAVLDHVAAEVVGRRTKGRPLLVAVDGIDGSGKSTFADELGASLTALNNTIVRATIDSFHNPRAVRWQRGKTSPVGFYLDSHNLDALRRELLDPFRSGPGARYRTAVFDEPTDRSIDEPGDMVGGDEILLFDGLFLLRPELASYWDFVVFLDGKARVDLSRLGHVLADAPTGGPALIDHVLGWMDRIDRYSSGMRIYLDGDNPLERANVVIDNNDFSKPFVRTDSGPG